MKHPFAVTTLLWLVLSLTAWNILRLGASIVNWNLLAEFASRPGPFYIAASATFWTLSGLATWIALRRRQPRAQQIAAAYLFGYATWWWADRILFQSDNPNWPFALVVTFILLGLCAINLFNRKTISYFRQRETHEQTPTDTKPE
jgi:hypothetical protein